MLNLLPKSKYPLASKGVQIKSMRFIPSSGSNCVNVFAQYGGCDTWVPLQIGLSSIPSLQQVRDVDRNISLNTGSYEDAHFYLRSADGNNINTAFFTNKDGGGIQSGTTTGYTALNLQPLGGLLNYGGKEVATKVWIQGQGYITTDTSLYNTNGTLTGDRSINGGGHNLVTYNMSTLSLNADDTQLTAGNSVVIQSNTSQIYLASLNGVNFQSVSGNSWAAIVKTSNLTADRNYEFPNASGTLALKSDIATLNLQAVASVGNSYLGDLILGAAGDEIFVGSGPAGVGIDNTRLGKNTLEQLTSGNYNTAIGSRALRSMKYGVNNVAIGEGTLQEFIGLPSGFSGNNTAVGDTAAAGMTQGYNNTFLGSTAGLIGGTARPWGDGNTFIGAAAGGAYQISSGTSTLGSYNLFMGYGAGTGPTDPFLSYQLRIGIIYNSATDIPIISGNMVQGAQALTFNAAVAVTSLAGAGNRIVVADSAGNLSTQAILNLQTVASAGNSYLGDLLLGKSGSQLYVGSGTVGTGNTRLGANSLTVATSGDWNTAIGNNALGALVGSDNNTAVGEGSLFAYKGITSYGSNSAFGDGAGANMTEGNDNLFLGVSAGSVGGTAMPGGSFNVFVGRSAGNFFGVSTSATLGSRNIYIGFGAGGAPQYATLSDKLLIGTNPTGNGVHIIEGSMVQGAQALTLNAKVAVASLAGTGNRMVVTDSVGNLSTQALPSGNQTLTWSGSTGDLSINGGNTVNLDGRYHLNMTSSIWSDTDLNAISTPLNTWVALSSGLYGAEHCGGFIAAGVGGDYRLPQLEIYGTYYENGLTDGSGLYFRNKNANANTAADGWLPWYKVMVEGSNSYLKNQTASLQNAGFWISGNSSGIGTAPGTFASLLNIGNTGTDGWNFNAKVVNITGDVGIAGSLNATAYLRASAFTENSFGYTLKGNPGFLGFYTDAGLTVALPIKAASLVVSDAYSDNAPANGLLVKGSSYLVGTTYTNGIKPYFGDDLTIGTGNTVVTIDASMMLPDVIPGALLKTDATGKVTSAIAGSDYVASENISSGTYVPSIQLTPGGTAQVADSFTFTRVGDVVQISGTIYCNGLTVGTSKITVSLPIPSNLITNASLSGVVSGTAINAALSNFVEGFTNDSALVTFSTGATASNVYFQFQYVVY